MDYDYFPGEGDFVFFLHGFGGSKESFKLLRNHLKNNLVFVSMPGFGNSPPPTRAYSIFDYADEVRSLIRSFACGSVIIVCHSFGARVASILAAERGLVKKLVIVDGAGLKPRFSLKTYLLIRKYKRLKKKVELGKANKEVLEGYGSSDYRGLSPVMKQTFCKVINENLKEYFKCIKCETLIIWGSDDRETPMYMARRMKRYIKNSALIVFKGAGHFSYLDRADIFIAVMKSFV